jgi:hypothetical protein
MIVTILKALVLVALILTTLAGIPDLFTPIADAADTAFGTTLSNFMNTIYDVIPDRVMALVSLAAGALTIAIIIRFFFGGNK